MGKENNNKIITAFIQNDDKILKEFYVKHLPMVIRYVNKNSGNEYDAKDVFQDAMVIVYEKVKNNTLDISCSLGTYVYGISKNLWRNRLRKNDKIIITEDITTNDGEGVETIIENIDRLDKIFLIQKYLLELGEGCKEILLLFFAGYSLREIAEKRKLTEAYARKRKFICQKQLMEKAEKDPIFKELKESSNYK
ncbi:MULTISPECIES: RNA polymerase sigma factor [Aquimarina]|uniref:Sigma-70 family RNA polymerase sigma factor n=1 Tax=Aquimarina algiphila TaxID=2047982 RepID=A0A554VAV9_9FLAO|nr:MULTISPECIES: sigma-70 family RNA polymerase sigma factor [Aquimarina]TSE03455.1 sigma-70 family RNA polymerase sigma factor [Aquimarina algiphila]